jgi:hypothetical protein
MLAIGANEFFRSDARPAFFTGPDWRQQVAAWRRGETRDLAIWPAPWKLRLSDPSGTASPATARGSIRVQ